ncbi:hypothetical protein BC939DRAFT_466222 [Gamsiella multidivaricata]|uniref:uncharacterized protein n=1 Tax=Gamsiella multidivaricata TaxID=101098 RepID=UPI00222085D3|nr:uncharacterized protein BC939DRAFT_466222 [Gamsiella multidivaricata]KAI7817372.1 hypothetical protein BC939DRAFT_466222 [Gamsiella multidivaricata]
MDVIVTVGSFRAHAVPEFHGDKPVLRCLKCQDFCANKDSFLKLHLYSMKCIWFATEEGLIEVAALTQDEKFGPAASAFLKRSPAVVGDGSFSSSVSSEDSRTARDVAELIEVADDPPMSQVSEISVFLPSYESLGPSDKRPSSPGLLSSATKLLNASTEVLISRVEDGIVSLDIKLNLSAQDLGVRDRPSQIEPAEGLLSLLADSPYEGVLSRSSWIEFPRCQRLPGDWDNLISGCWLKNPLLNYATAVLFAGCVLYNPRNRNAVLCLVAESYGRGLDVDVHAEKPISIGQGVSSISQPSASGLYPHATVCQIQHDKKDHRLVVGCKIFNILATEVWRLDKDCSSDRAFTAGSCCSAFPIPGSENIIIFVDRRSFDLASDVVSGTHIPRFEIDLLRQIRSNLCSEHSYRMGRASSYFITNMVSAQSASIFTLTMVCPSSGDASLVSSLLSRIAKEVNAKGDDAVLEKKVLLKILQKVKSGQSCDVLLRKILSLIENKLEISILGVDRPSGLEELMGELAGCVSAAVYRCNEKVVVPQLKKEMPRLLC